MPRLKKPILLTLLLLAALALPAQQRNRLPDLKETGMVVPWEDFKKILEELMKGDPDPTPDPPPVPYALSSCAVRAAVNGDEKQAEVTLDFTVRVLAADKWVEVPVIGEGVALKSLTMDGRAVSTYRKGGWHTVAVKGAGLHRFELSYLAAVNQSRGTHSTYLKFPQAPVITLDITVPRDDIGMNAGNSVVWSKEVSGGKTRIKAAFQYAYDTTLTWFKDITQDEKDTKVFGEVNTLLSLGEGMVRGTANVSSTIHGKGVNRFRLELPAGMTVLDVNAHGVSNWQVLDAAAANAAFPDADPIHEGRQCLVVELSYHAKNSYAFPVSFEMSMGGTTAEVDLPDIVLLDVLRDKGFIAVAAATNVEISLEGSIKNATPVDPAELPGVLSQSGASILYGFKYLQHPVQATLKVTKHEDLEIIQTLVQEATLISFLNPQGKLITSATYTVINNRKQYLTVTLPEGGEAWGVFLDGMPVKAAKNKEGAILVPLKKASLNGSEPPPFDVEIVYFQEEPEDGLWGEHEFTGPALDVTTVNVDWHLYLPRDKRYSDFNGPNMDPLLTMNRVLYLGDVAYNLALDEDVSSLQAQSKNGRLVITDGRNEVDLDRLGGERRQNFENVTPNDLNRIQGLKGQLEGQEEAQRELNEKLDKEEDLRDELSSLGYVGDKDRAGEDKKLKSRVDAMRQGKAYQQMVPPQISTGGITQGNQHLDPPQGTFGANANVNVTTNMAPVVGGKGKGVLPVRFAIPLEGLRLSFAGTMVLSTDEDNPAPKVTMRVTGGGESIPDLDWGAVYTLSLILALGLVLLFARKFSTYTGALWLTLLAFIAGYTLLIIFYFPHQSNAFIAGSLTAVGLYLAGRLLTARMGQDQQQGGF